jgi:hypothetical protein
MMTFRAPAIEVTSFLDEVLHQQISGGAPGLSSRTGCLRSQSYEVRLMIE